MSAPTPLMELKLNASISFHDKSGTVRAHNGLWLADCHTTPTGRYGGEFNLDNHTYQVGFALSREYHVGVGIYTIIGGTYAGTKSYELVEATLTLKDLSELLEEGFETKTITLPAFMHIAQYGRSKSASVMLEIVRTKKTMHIARVEIKVDPEDARYIVERVALYKKQLGV